MLFLFYHEICHKIKKIKCKGFFLQFLRKSFII